MLPLPKLYAIKLFSIAADYVGAFFIYKIVRQRFPRGPRSWIAAFGFLFLPTVWLNSAVWGQCDAMVTTALLAAFFYALVRRPLAAAIAFGFACALKPQAIFLIPFLGGWFFRERLPWKILAVPPLVYAFCGVPAILGGKPFFDVVFRWAEHKNTPELTLGATNWYQWVSNDYYAIFFYPGIVLAAVATAFLILAMRQPVRTNRRILVHKRGATVRVAGSLFSARDARALLLPGGCLFTSLRFLGRAWLGCGASGAILFILYLSALLVQAGTGPTPPAGPRHDRGPGFGRGSLRKDSPTGPRSHSIERNPVKAESPVLVVTESDTETPLVSVVMAVYNTARFLPEAIRSIQSQTYSRWELVCFDDGSIDGSWEFLRSFAARDDRIRVFRDGKHRGVAGTANLALAQARGDMIARMDADDIAYPYRLERQVGYLLKHKETIAVGGQCLLIDSDGKTIGRKRFPTDAEKVRRLMFSATAVQQPSMMVAQDRLPRDFTWYREGGTVAIDVELLFRMLQHGQVTNLADLLIKYRIHPGNISLKRPKTTFYIALRERVRAVYAYGYRPSPAGIFITLAQLVLITLMPGRWIYPTYSLIRGMRVRQSEPNHIEDSPSETTGLNPETEPAKPARHQQLVHGPIVGSEKGATVQTENWSSS